MKKQLKYMIIDYAENDLGYIDLLYDKLDKISDEIVNFFDIKNFGQKINVVLNNSLNKFRKNIEKY